MGVVIQDMDVVARKSADDDSPPPPPEAADGQSQQLTARDIERVIEQQAERYERVRAH